MIGLYRSLSRFLYGTEALHERIRNEIYKEALKRSANYPDITLTKENGPMRIKDYINSIKNEYFYGGELEITISASLYNINIATFNEIYKDNRLIGLSFINYYNNDRLENRHLLILTNINNSHYRIGYYNLKLLTNEDLHYKINLESQEVDKMEISDDEKIGNKDFNIINKDKIKVFGNLEEYELDELLEFYADKDNNK